MVGMLAEEMGDECFFFLLLLSFFSQILRMIFEMM